MPHFVRFFSLSGQEFAVNIEHIREISRVDYMTDPKAQFSILFTDVSEGLAVDHYFDDVIAAIEAAHAETYYNIISCRRRAGLAAPAATNPWVKANEAISASRRQTIEGREGGER